MDELRRKKILVVEDNEDLGNILRIQLESSGFSVQLKTNGLSAVDYASSHPLDLVILDLRLPDISGYQVCKELRKVYHPWVLPILMLTAMDKPFDQLRGFAHGADAYLTKPHQPKELLRTVDLLLE